GAGHGRAPGGARRGRTRARAGGTGGRRRPRAAAGRQQPRPAQLRGLARDQPAPARTGPGRSPAGDRERHRHRGRRVPAARGGYRRLPRRRGVHARSRPRHRAATAILRRMTSPAAATGRRLVVFDFDHTLYGGDSGAHLVSWLIRRNGWRKALALLAAPVLLPMVAWLPTRRAGISGFLWIGTVGARRDIDTLIDDYVCANAASIRARLLVPALAVLHRHREAGDEVVIATGAPPELARAI